MLAALLAGPAAACETALLLAVDVSGSIDPAEYRLQAEGMAAALRDPAVAEELLRGQVALAVLHWSGAGQQALVQPWRRMLDLRDIAAFADRAAAAPRAFAGSDTAVGQAITAATAAIAAVPDCRRRIIDISGDGPENAGFTLSSARAAALAARIAINAIAIEEAGPAAPVTAFYSRLVVTPGGFVVTARGMEDYAATLRLKLLRELARPLG